MHCRHCRHIKRRRHGRKGEVAEYAEPLLPKPPPHPHPLTSPPGKLLPVGVDGRKHMWGKTRGDTDLDVGIFFVL